MKWLIAQSGAKLAHVLLPVIAPAAGRIIVGVTAAALAALGLGTLDAQAAEECLKLSSNSALLKTHLPLMVASGLTATL